MDIIHPTWACHSARVFNASYIGSALSAPPYTEERFNPSIYWKRVSNASYIIWQIKKEMKIFFAVSAYRERAGSSRRPFSGSVIDMMSCAADFPHTLHALNSRLGGPQVSTCFTNMHSANKEREKTLRSGRVHAGGSGSPMYVEQYAETYRTYRNWSRSNGISSSSRDSEFCSV